MSQAGCIYRVTIQMRAPQYGCKGKRRSNNAALPPMPEYEAKRALRPVEAKRERKRSREDTRIYIWGAGHFARGLHVAVRGGSK